MQTLDRHEKKRNRKRGRGRCYSSNQLFFYCIYKIRSIYKGGTSLFGTDDEPTLTTSFHLLLLLLPPLPDVVCYRTYEALVFGLHASATCISLGSTRLPHQSICITQGCHGPSSPCCCLDPRSSFSSHFLFLILLNIFVHITSRGREGSHHCRNALWTLAASRVVPSCGRGCRNLWSLRLSGLSNVGRHESVEPGCRPARRELHHYD